MGIAGRFARILVAAGAGFAALSLAAPSQAQPPLWTVSDEDSEIHLFGTIHLLPEGLEWRTAEMEAAFDAAEIVYFETPVLDPQAQAEVAPVIMSRGMNPAGVTLSSLLSEEGNARLAEVGAELGFSPVVMEPVAPWFAAMQIGVRQIMSAGYDPESGVESVLWPEAVEAGKELAFFETLSEQIGFFADLPQEVQIDFLEGALAQIDETPDMLDDLVEAWIEGDMARFEALMNDAARDEAPEVYEALLVRRNAAWVEEIETMLEGEGVIFIAVGSGHLPGEDGVVAMLRARGHFVEGP